MNHWTEISEIDMDLVEAALIQVLLCLLVHGRSSVGCHPQRMDPEVGSSSRKKMRESAVNWTSLSSQAKNSNAIYGYNL